MRLFSFILLFSLISIHAFPQCDPATTEAKPKAWGRSQDSFISDPSKQHLPRMKALVEILANKVKAAYPNPTGCEPKWYGLYRNNPLDYYPNSTVFSCVVPVFMWRCLNNKEFLSGEAITVLYIEVNKYGFIINHITINGKVYKTLRPVSDVKNGFQHFQMMDEGMNSEIKRESWLITKAGQLPYKPITRREYLSLINANDNSGSDPEQPAIILPYGRFEGFAKAEKDPNAVMLIRDNPDYFDLKLPMSTPQYMTVFIKHDKTSKASNEFYNSILQNLKLEELQSMLGK